LTALALQELPFIAFAATRENAYPGLSFICVGYSVLIPQLATVDSGRVCHAWTVSATAQSNIVGGKIITSGSAPCVGPLACLGVVVEGFLLRSREARA